MNVYKKEEKFLQFYKGTKIFNRYQLSTGFNFRHKRIYIRNLTEILLENS